VKRRASDLGAQPIPLQGTVLDMDAYRPREVEAYLILNAKVSYAVTSWLTLGLEGTNLADKRYVLPKTLAFPFDYQGAGRNLSFLARANF
jgi:outer membrane receptor protein involved in Fe transport